MYGMTFNGERKDYVVVMRGTRRPAWAPLSRNFIDVEGMAGSYLDSTTVGNRIIEVPILIESKNLTELEKLKEEVAEWLITTEAKELIFDDEPDRVYYAMVDGQLDINEIVRVGVGMVTFKCSDPYKYDTETQTRTFLSDLENVVNNGHVSTYPIFRAKVKESITHFDVITDGAYMRAGKPYTVEETPFEPMTLVLNDSMASLVGWGEATSADNGYVAGTINTDGTGFYPVLFGGAITPYRWQGPSLKKAIGESLKDFQMDALVELLNGSGDTGMLEIYLLDNANNVVGKIGIEDLYSSTNNTHGKAKVGDASTGKWFADEYATDNVKNWFNFKGMIRIKRVNNKWSAYFAVIDKNGRHINRRGDRGQLVYNDIKGTYGQNVSQIQIAFRKMGGHNRVTPMRIDDIKVWRINEKVEQEIPYIAHANDEIVFDHKTNDIRINGESRIDLKDFGASYFPLKKGENIINFSPSTAADLTVEWKERFN